MISMAKGEDFDAAQSADSTLSVRLSRYALVAGATGVAGAAAGLEVYLDNLGIEVNQFSSQDLDFLLDGEPDLLLKNYIFGAGNYQGAYVNFFPGAMVGFTDPNTNLAYASVLQAGDPINADSIVPPGTNPVFQASLAYGTANPNAQWNDVTGGYLGLRFPDEQGTITFYAWVRMDINNTNGTMFIDAAFASDDPNGIVAGQTSTPGDYNGSGAVEQGDLNLVLTNWGVNTAPEIDGGVGVPEGWFNNLPTDLVDQDELNLVLNNWGNASAPPSFEGFAVPEPGTLGLLAAGAIGLAKRRRNRRSN
ncbi:MAG: PEP-CTERM sorting domain-containing protein [Planctomycetota bacterium]